MRTISTGQRMGAQGSYVDHFRGVHAAVGLCAGLGAGVVMALVMMAHSRASGAGFWVPMQLISAVFYGESALSGGAWAAIVGTLIHLVVSAAWGSVFSQFVGPSTKIGAAFAGAIAFGVVVWAVMTYAVLPWANPAMFDRVVFLSRTWFGYHLVYATLLAATPALLRVVAREAVHGSEVESETFRTAA